MRWTEWVPGEPGPGGGALRVAQSALLILAFVLPFSIAMTEAALIAGIGALLVSLARAGRLRAPSTWLWPASLALAACWLLSSAFSSNPADSFFHARKLYALGLIPLAAVAARDPRVRSRIVPHVLTGAALTALIGFLIYMVRVPSQPNYRLQSVLSNQMTSGGVLSAAFLWAMATALGGSSRRWLRVTVAIPLALALALTQTRSHWLGTAAGAIAILIALAPRWWWAPLVTVAAGIRFAPAHLAARFYSIIDPNEPGNRGRLSMWRSARDIVRDHPLIGVGCQDLLSLYRRYRYPDWTFESGHFHNNFIQIAVMTGALGLAAFLFWLVAGACDLGRAMAVARGGDRGLAAAGIGIFTALLVSGMFDYTFGDAEVVYHTFLALGLAGAIIGSRDADAVISGAAVAARPSETVSATRATLALAVDAPVRGD